MSPRLLALSLCCLAVSTSDGQAADPWHKLRVLDTNELVVRLKIRTTASLASEKWIEFEFENLGAQPVMLRDVSYRFAARGVDPNSATPLYTGSLGQGSALDLFDTSQKSEGLWKLPPGSTIAWRHPSDYAAALMTDREPATLVEAELRMSVTLADGRVLRIKNGTKNAIATSFLWRKWRPSETSLLLARLRKLLNEPPAHHSAGYAVERLLKVPAIAEQISSKELLEALPRHLDSAFSGREPILEHLNAHHHSDDAVTDFVYQQLVSANSKRSDSMIQLLLFRMPRVWREDFLPPLLNLYEDNPSTRYMILRHLSLQDLPKREDQALAKRLSSVFFNQPPDASRSTTKAQPDAQSNSNAVVSKLNEGIADPKILRMLGRTRDQRLVNHLAPLLRDQRPLPHAGLDIARQRVCDVAREAIESILGPQTAENVTTDRDEAIARLEKRLKANPMFAGAIRPQSPTDDKRLQKIVARWKVNRRSHDFLQLKPKIVAGLSEARVRDLLGAPIRIEQQGDKRRFLYLEPDFRNSLGAYYWLEFDSQQSVARWHTYPWDKRYSPQSAPRLMRQRLLPKVDHGAWEDVFLVHDRDEIILRQGTKWTRVALPNGDWTTIGDFARTQKSTIKHSLGIDDQQWLLCESDDTAPFALHLQRGDRVAFATEGADLPATIQSHIVTPSGGVLLMISGGDEAKWPRDGNRPLYYWFDLSTGKAKPMPTGWDASTFAPDLSIVSGTLRGKSIAYDMATGRQTREKADWPSHVPFNWTNTDPEQPLSKGPDQLLGVCSGGQTHLFETPILAPHLPRFQRTGEGLAFHLRRTADASRSWTLWTSTISPNQHLKPEFVGQDVRQWCLLSSRHCIYTTNITTSSGSMNEAFVWDAERMKIWNVLDGVEGLEGAAHSVRVAPPMGSASRGQLALCMIQGRQSPTDFRTQWRRWIIVASNGKRALVEEIPKEADGNIAQLRLHNSGMLVLTTYEHDEAANPQVRFRLTTFELANDPSLSR